MPLLYRKVCSASMKTVNSCSPILFCLPAIIPIIIVSTVCSISGVISGSVRGATCCTVWTSVPATWTAIMHPIWISVRSVVCWTTRKQSFWWVPTMGSTFLTYMIKISHESIIRQIPEAWATSLSMQWCAMQKVESGCWLIWEEWIIWLNRLKDSIIILLFIGMEVWLPEKW